MVRVRCSKVKPGQLERLRSWMGELTDREEEVRETFRHETVRHEVALLIDGAEGPVLVYIVEAEDLNQAARAAEESTLPIDLEHRRVMSDVLGEPVKAERLLDIALDP